MQEHIYPIFDRILSRQDKERLLQQRAKVIWMTGLSGSGKSTLAQALEQDLHAEGMMTKLLDGDNVRTGLCNNLGFSDADRSENIRRVAEAARLFLDAGIICICSFVSPTSEIRDLARRIIGSEDFLEVYVNASLEACEARDVKGLYKKARAGLIPDFTGISAPFEAPEAPFIELKTDLFEFEICRNTLIARVRPEIMIL